MSSQTRLLLPLILGAAIFGLGTTLLSFAMQVRAQNIGGEGLAGLAFGLYYAGFFFGVLYSRRTIRRVGQIRAYAAYATVVSIVAIAPNLFEFAAFDLVLRFLTGLSFAGAFTAVDSWLNDGADEESRSNILGIYYSCIVMGHILGHLAAAFPGVFLDVEVRAGELVIPSEFFVLATLLISLSLVPIVLTQGRGPITEADAPLSVQELFQTSPVGAFGSFTAGVIVSNTQGLMPSFGFYLGLSNSEAIYLIIAILIGGFIVQYPVGWLTKRIDRRILIIGVCAIGMASSGLIALLIVPEHHLSPLLVFALFAILGGMTYLIYPLAIAQVYDYLDHSKYVGATVGLLIVYSVGSILGSVLTGQAMALVPSALFWILGLMFGVFAILVIYRVQARVAPAPEDQGDFIPVPLTSATLAEMDPRTEPALDEEGATS